MTEFKKRNVFVLDAEMIRMSHNLGLDDLRVLFDMGLRLEDTEYSLDIEEVHVLRRLAELLDEDPMSAVPKAKGHLFPHKFTERVNERMDGSKHTSCYYCWMVELHPAHSIEGEVVS